jgi:hypothetical protein
MQALEKIETIGETRRSVLALLLALILCGALAFTIRDVIWPGLGDRVLNAESGLAPSMFAPLLLENSNV